MHYKSNKLTDIEFRHRHAHVQENLRDFRESERKVAERILLGYFACKS